MKHLHSTLLLVGALLFPVLATTTTTPSATVTPQTCSTPSPSRYHCGDHGTLGQPAHLTSPFTASASSLNACRDACFSTSACRSFSFKSPSGPCALLSKLIAKQAFTKGHARTSYWDTECFSCMPTPPPVCNATYAQAVANPGFENEPYAPWIAADHTGTGIDQGYIYQEEAEEDAHTGIFSIESTAMVGGYQNLNQTLACVNPGVPYTFEGYFGYYRTSDEETVNALVTVMLDGVTIAGPVSVCDCTTSTTDTSSCTVIDQSTYCLISVDNVVSQSQTPVLGILLTYPDINDTFALPAFIDDVTLTEA